MHIKFSLTLKNYVDFNLYHMKHSKSMRRNFIILRYIIPLIFLICGFILYYLSNGDNVKVYFYITLGVVVYITIFSKIYVDQIKKGIIKLINEGKTDDLLGEQTISLKDDYLENNTVGGCEQLRYNMIERIEANEEYVYIYINSISAFIIPNSAFSNQEEKDKFMKILKEKANIIQ